MSLGTNISRLRAEKRLSQGDLAEVLEVSRQSVSKWETDSSVPDLNRLMKLSQLFGVTLDELVTGAEPPVKVETPPVMVSPSMPGRKIAGIILFCMAFLAFLIPTVLGGILVGLILAVPFLVCGIICFLVRKRPGLWCAWAVGERESLRIGVLEPENGCLQIRRRFSKRLTDPLGPILRGELRPLGEEREQWEPLRPELLRSPYLRCRLGGLSDVLTCRPERGRLIAVPRDDAAPFPLEAMFCFARSRRLQGRAYWVFRFDDREWPVF